MPNLDNPAYQSISYLAQLADWKLVNDCFAGTSRLHQKGATYLPRHPAEMADDYAVRLFASNFWNAYKRTIQGLTGMVFRKDPMLGEDVPQQIAGVEGDGESKTEGHWENIDLAGTHGDVFAKDCFRAALNDGHTFILVEMPPPVTAENPQATQRDENGRRPYWVHVNKNQVVNWITRLDQGRVVLDQVTIREVICEEIGRFEEKEVTRYRVLTPGHWELFEEKESNSKEISFDLIEEGDTSLQFIPLVPIYTNRTGYFESIPPLLDVANENLRHYRLQSDLDHILHVANVPILYTTGRDSTTPLIVGPNSCIGLPEGGTIGYAEHQGHAIGAAQSEIDKSKANMATLGLLLLSQQPKVTQTATETALDYEAESSELAGMARGLEDGLEQALMYHANYMKLDGGGSVTINKDFARLALDAQKITIFSTMVEKEQLRLETLWSMLEKAEELPATFNPDDEKAALDNQPSLKKVQVQRAQVGLQNDQQAATGDPLAIRQRIMSGAIDATGGAAQ